MLRWRKGPKVDKGCDGRKDGMKEEGSKGKEAREK